MSALRFVSVKTRVRPGYWSSTVRSMPGFWSSSTFMHCCSTLPLAAPTLHPALSRALHAPRCPAVAAACSAVQPELCPRREGGAHGTQTEVLDSFDPSLAAKALARYFVM